MILKMARFNIRLSLFFVPVLVAVVCYYSTIFFEKRSTFFCKADVYYLDRNQFKNISSTLQFSLYMNGLGEGDISIYGYKNKSNNDGTVIKLARRLNFEYLQANGAFHLKMKKTLKYNNDTATDSDLPEFISNSHPVFHISKLQDVEYIIKDEVSPAFICSAVP